MSIDPFAKIPDVDATGLILALDRYHPESGAHSRRVRDICKRIGGGYFTDPDQLRILESAALLHDIGKLFIPTELLSKPGPLDAQEWETLQMHPVLGYEILYPTYPAEAVVARNHHKFGERRYPIENSYDDFNLIARVVAFADVYDALVNPRSYKRPWDAGEAKRELYSTFRQHDKAVERFLELV